MIETIKQIIEGIGLTYFRSNNTSDLSQIATVNKMENIGVLAGMFDIDASVSQTTGSILEKWDVTVLFLTLSPGLDATAEQIDTAIAPLYDKAHEFLSQVTNTFPMTHLLEDYTLNSSDGINITTEVLIGWELKLQIPIQKMLCST